MARTGVQLAMRLFYKQRGDTILEVLIAVAVLSFALATSYTMANRSVLSVRQAQERAESSKITNSQLERLKQYMSVPSQANLIPPAGSVFCVNADGTAIDVFSGPTPPTDAQTETFTEFTASLDTTCKSSLGVEYYSYIVRGTGSQQNTYTVHTRAFAVRGSRIEESTTVYRVYPDSISVTGSNPIVTGGCPVNQFMNPFGVCLPCSPPHYPLNYFSGGGSTSTCEPIPPRITVLAYKVNPNGDNTTPSCNGPTGTSFKGGSTISLTGGPAVAPQTTDGTSSTTFFNLAFGTNYTAGFTVPAGTNPASIYWAGGEPSFSPCPPPTTTTATPPTPTLPLGLGAGSQQTAAPAFKFRPNCYIGEGNRYYHHNEWHDNGTWHDHGYDYTTYSDYAQIHTGLSTYYPGVPNGFQQYENSQVGYTDPQNGSPVVLAKYFWPGPPANSTWRNRFEMHRFISGTAHYYDWHYHENWVLHQTDYRGDPYNACPN